MNQLIAKLDSKIRRVNEPLVMTKKKFYRLRHLNSLDGAFRDVVGDDFVDQPFRFGVDADDLFGVTDRTESGSRKRLENLEAARRP